MPMYDYRCDKCNKLWEENLSMSNSNKPCENPCPYCQAEGFVKKHVGGFPAMAVDTTMTADKKTGGRWSEIMNKIKDATPDRHHDNLSHDLSGKKWRS